MITEDEIVKAKQSAMGNELGRVAIQGVRAILKRKYIDKDGVKYTEPAEGRSKHSTGYTLVFEKHDLNGYISADEAKELGLITVIGEDENGKRVLQWTASQLGFQPNPDATKRGTWQTA